MTPISYVVGDATAPLPSDQPRIVAHVCNDVGVWGAGFVLAVSARWPGPERAYREMAPVQRSLGQLQLVRVAPGLAVANMIAQRGVGHGRRVNYDALGRCLQGLAVHARLLGASVHMPRVGCGLGGGTWAEVEPIVEEQLCLHDVPTFVYDLA